MDISRMLTELRQELAYIDEAVQSLERLAAAPGRKRRGRPPAWLTQQAQAEAAPKRRGRPPGSKNKKPPAEKAAE